MKTLSSYAGQELEIVQPSIWKQRYDILANGEPVGSIRFPRMFSTLMEVELFGRQWEIDKPSLWRPEYDIRPKGNQMPIAHYVGQRWKGGGTVELPRGDRLIVVQKMMKQFNEITTQSGTPLVQFRNKSFFSRTIRVILLTPSDLLDEHPWVIVIAWKLIQDQRNRAAAVH